MFVLWVFQYCPRDFNVTIPGVASDVSTNTSLLVFKVSCTCDVGHNVLRITIELLLVDTRHSILGVVHLPCMMVFTYDSSIERSNSNSVLFHDLGFSNGSTIRQRLYP